MDVWFTETAWPPIIVLLASAGAMLGMFVTTQRGKFLIAAMALLIPVPMIYFAERSIVTERERIEAHLMELADAFEHQEYSRILQLFSERAAVLRTAVGAGLEIVEPRGSVSLTDVRISLHNRESRARSHFRAVGPIAVAQIGDVGIRRSRWEFTWQKEGSDWRIIQVERLDPVTGEPIPLLSRTERVSP